MRKQIQDHYNYTVVLEFVGLPSDFQVFLHKFQALNFKNESKSKNQNYLFVPFHPKSIFKTSIEVFIMLT